MPHADLLDETRRSLTRRQAEILAVARSHHDRSGRGGLVAVHADGVREFTLYRAPADLDAPDEGGGLAAIREAVRDYDPEREAVVLVVDSARDLYSCWRIGGAADAPQIDLVWSA